MFSKFQILSFAGPLSGTLLCFSILGCGPANSVEVSNGTPKKPAIEKGTSTVSTIEGNAGLLKLVFDELSWSVRSADIAVNKIGQDEVREGCVTYTRPVRGGTFAIARFNCSRKIALGGPTDSHRRTLTGEETYTEQGPRSAFINMRSSIEQSVFALKDSKLVGRGSFTRSLKMNRPQILTDANLASFGFDAQSKYLGAVASGSGRLAEEFAFTLKGDFDSSRFSGMKLPKGLALSLAYVPERTKSDQLTVRLALTATNDITYSTDGTCLRPIGTFSWSRTANGKTASGTLTTTSVGIAVSGEPETIPWGRLCLEQ